MRIMMSPPEPMGSINPVLFGVVHRPLPPLCERDIYVIGPDNHPETFQAASLILKGVTSAVRQHLPLFQNAELSALEILRSQADNDEPFLTNTRRIHTDLPVAGTIEVLFTDTQPTEYIFGAYNNPEIPDGTKPGSQLEDAVRDDLDCDQAILDRGLSIMQAMPYQAMMAWANTWHRTPAVNCAAERVERTHVAAIYRYATELE